MRVLLWAGKCGAARGGIPNDGQTDSVHNHRVVAYSLLQFLPAPQGTVRHGTFHTFVFANKAYLESFMASYSHKSMSDVRQI